MHMERQMVNLLVVDVVGVYINRVTVRRVTKAMANIEKSTACAENCPMNPLTVHRVPGESGPFLRCQMPDVELFKLFENSDNAVELVVKYGKEA